MQVAVLGTGTMGAGMARSLRRAGHDVRVWNRTRSRAAPLIEDGITVSDDVASAVRGAQVVVTMLFDTDSVLAVTDELVGALHPEAVWLQSATVGPDGIAAIAERAGTDRLVDAPVLGTKQPAEQGELVVLLSGGQSLIDAAAPALDAVGARTVAAGPALGTASALKLACNAWVLTLTAATAQSVALARGLGVDAGLFLRAIQGGAVDSPYAQLKGSAMIAGDFTPSFELTGGSKDLGLIAAAAAGAGVDTTLVDAVLALYDRAAEAGQGHSDIAAVAVAFGA